MTVFLSDSDRPVIVVPATPTNNGALHVGHLAGPYLAADVFARYYRACGRQVVYTTCTDDSQTYVLATAHRAGLPAGKLSEDATAAISRSFDAIGVAYAGLPPIDENYRSAVKDFAARLHAAGALELRTVRMPYATGAERFLYDGLVSGICPSCLSDSCGGGCENCGHPNNFDELLEPKFTMDPSDVVEHRECEILVLPLERHRAALTAYYDRHLSTWRPNARQLVTALLSQPLPDVPVTVPGTWGLAASFAETPGHMFYPWIEAMPAIMYSTWWSARQLDATGSAGSEPALDELWRAERDPEIVFFHGFDNVYHWGLMDVALLLAHGDRYATPSAVITNEFYELDGEKFSTSRNHLVLAEDLLARVPRDLVRFHLCMTAPETQRTNFTETSLRETVTTRLLQPWQQLSDLLRQSPAIRPGETIPVSDTGRARAQIMSRRLARWYRPDEFSLRGLADEIASHLRRLAGTPVTEQSAGEILAQVHTLLCYAAPILIDTASQLAAAGVDLRPDEAPPTVLTAFQLPPLPALKESTT